MKLLNHLLSLNVILLMISIGIHCCNARSARKRTSKSRYMNRNSQEVKDLFTKENIALFSKIISKLVSDLKNDLAILSIEKETCEKRLQVYDPAEKGKPIIAIVFGSEKDDITLTSLLYEESSNWSSCRRSCVTSRIRKCRVPNLCEIDVFVEEAYCFAPGTKCQDKVIDIFKQCKELENSASYKSTNDSNDNVDEHKNDKENVDINADKDPNTDKDLNSDKDPDTDIDPDTYKDTDYIEYRDKDSYNNKNDYFGMVDYDINFLKGHDGIDLSGMDEVVVDLYATSLWDSVMYGNQDYYDYNSANDFSDTDDSEHVEEKKEEEEVKEAEEVEEKAPEEESSTIAAKVKPEYSFTLINDCGNSPITAPYQMFRIIGGGEVIKGSWPWQVAILNKFKEVFCGGTLIAPNWVLTAAHCVRKKLFVRIGEHDINTADGEIELKVTKSFKHSKYNTKTIDNDIALLKIPVVTKRRRSTDIKTACLPLLMGKLPTKQSCVVLGWGKEKENNLFGSDILRFAKVPIAKQKSCEKVYKDHGITKNMFCAGVLTGGLDTCEGDSGGPLLCKDNKTNRWILQGVTSFGEGCGDRNRLGVYVKVANYVQWINKTISQNE